MHGSHFCSARHAPLSVARDLGAVVYTANEHVAAATASVASALQLVGIGYDFMLSRVHGELCPHESICDARRMTASVTNWVGVEP